MAHKGGLVGLAAMRHGRQIRSIGFYQQAFTRDFTRHVTQGLGIAKGNDPE